MNILLATILAPLLGVLAVFILIVVLVWMRKTRKGPFKYAGFVFFVIYIHIYICLFYGG